MVKMKIKDGRIQIFIIIMIAMFLIVLGIRTIYYRNRLSSNVELWIKEWVKGLHVMYYNDRIVFNTNYGREEIHTIKDIYEKRYLYSRTEPEEIASQVKGLLYAASEKANRDRSHVESAIEYDGFRSEVAKNLIARVVTLNDCFLVCMYSVFIKSEELSYRQDIVKELTSYFDSIRNDQKHGRNIVIAKDSCAEYERRDRDLMNKLDME